jgi:hypothetical protein
VDIASGVSTFGIVIGDYDGDGKPDVVTLNNTVQTVSFFRNTSTPGNISFAPKVDYATMLGPKTIVGGDFDGDGKMDIAFTNETSNTFSIYRNTSTAGSITMAPRVDIACGSGNNPNGITMGDLNEDSKMDLVVVINNGTGGGAQLFKNNSTPGTISFAFSSSVSSGAASNTCFHAAVNDINGDGKPDIALTVQGSSTGQTQLYQNNTTGAFFSFGSFNAVFSSFAPYALFLGDLEGDSKPDLVIGEFTLEKISAFRNKSGAPNITSFSPTSAGTNATVTINGSNFTGVTSVTFGGVSAASFGIVNSTTISATVGTGASGAVTVTNPLGTASLAGFIHNSPPVISSFTPTSAGSGTTVTITGTGFTGATAVKFGGVAATSFTVVNATTITAVVGTGASGSVSVTTGFGTGSLPGFTYIVPVINSFAPTSAGTGTVVTITGDNFTGATTVTFGGTAARTFTVQSPTTITAEIAGGSSGNVVVTTPIGVATSAGFVFTSPQPPVITTFTPSSGPPGSTVIINGANFNAVPVNNVVYFGSTKATVTGASAAQLTVTVPNGSTYKPISVLNLGNNLLGYSISPFIPTFPNGGVINNTSFPQYTNISTFGGPSSGLIDSEVGDLDGDGRSDLVFSHINGPVGICLNTGIPGTVSFSSIFYLSGFSTERVNLADIDGDGKPDIIGSVGSLLSVARNTSTLGNLSFAPTVSFFTLFTGQKLGIDDVNGDGKADLIVPFSNSLIMSVYVNTSIPGIISFGVRTDLTTLGQSYEICMGDIDSDGKKDIVISYGSQSSKISIYRNTSTSGVVSFSPKTDGKNDICVSNSWDRYFSVFKNNSLPGVVSLQARTDIVYPTNMFNRSVDIGDVDGDSKLDVIVGVDFSAPGTLVYKNNSTVGTISLSLAAQLDSGNPWITTLADMDGDTKPDIIDVVPDWNVIRIYKNKTNEPGLTMFSPGSGTIGTTITLTGVNFTGATAVSFGGLPASSFNVVNSTTITAVVANGASGIISVTTPYGTATINGFTFYLLPPSISSFTPGSARAGAVVTITGTNFNGTSTVRFGGTDAASFIVVNNNTIQAIVGSGATGAVQVSHAGGSATMPGFDFVTGPIQIYTLRICPQGSVFVTAVQTGSAYQWQVEDGSGFTNIADNSNYNGTSNSLLQIISPAASWYGYMYRCLITTPSGLILSPVYILKFETVWTGTNNSDWYSPMNWGCGVLPNDNTDVIIPASLSNYPVINVPVTCRSLYLHPTANIIVGTGVNLTIKGQAP